MVIDLTYHGAVRVSRASDHGVDGRPVLRKLLREGFDDVFVEFLDLDGRDIQLSLLAVSPALAALGEPARPAEERDQSQNKVK